VPFNANDPINEWRGQFDKMINPRCQYNPEYLDGLVAYASDGDENDKIPGQQGMLLHI
jgi:hypothetical protein